MKLERLIYILLSLLNKKRITAKEIAERFEISTELYIGTWYTQFKGIPIYSERGDKGGFYIPSDYKIDRNFSLRKRDSLSLIWAKMLVKSLVIQVLTVSNTSCLLKKLQEQIVLLLWSQFLDSNTNYLLDIEEAQTEQMISFLTIRKTGESQRTIIPLGLIYKLNAWYVIVTA